MQNPRIIITDGPNGTLKASFTGALDPRVVKAIADGLSEHRVTTVMDFVRKQLPPDQRCAVELPHDHSVRRIVVRPSPHHA